jgi:hypothetical protein
LFYREYQLETVNAKSKIQTLISFSIVATLLNVKKNKKSLHVYFTDLNGTDQFKNLNLKFQLSSSKSEG